MSTEDGQEQKSSLDWKWFIIAGVAVALVGTVIVLSMALVSGQVKGIPSLGGTRVPTQPANGAVISVTQEASGLWEALVLDPYNGPAPAATMPAFPPITLHETFGVSGQVCVVNSGSQVTDGLHMLGDLQYAEPSGLFRDMNGVRFEYYATEGLAPGEGRCYLYRMEFLPVTGATYRIRTQVTVLNEDGWLPGGDNCPGPEKCPTGPRIDTSFTLPKEPSNKVEITATPFFPTATVTITFTPTTGPTYTRLPSSTSTRTPTKTVTRTLTASPTSTSTITMTPVPPTSTATAMPTSTATAPPTSTATDTLTPAPSPTSAPTESSNPSQTPTPTATGNGEGTPTG